MSRLLREGKAGAAISFGSFVVRPRDPTFVPWGEDSEAPAPGNDRGDEASTPEQELLNVRDQAYAQGIEDGRRAMEKALDEERAAIARLAASLEGLRPEPTGPLALLLAETVDRLVREILGEVDIDANRLLARAKAAAALIGKAVEPSRLRVHPDDVDLLAPADLPVPVEGDPSLARGSIVLETAEGWIEDGPAVRLERLRAALDKMAATR
jgi:flagellar assembly protein FliH